MKTMRASALRAAVVAAAALIITACGGGSGSTSGTNVNPTGGGGGTSAINVSGAGIKGVAKYAKVVAQELNADGTAKQQLGTAITDANGHYSLSLPSAYGGGPIVLTLSDAANSAQPTVLVCDVASGCGNKSQYAFGTDYPIGELVMKALLGKASGTTVTAQITPLTTVAADSSLAAAKSGQSLTAALVNAENTGLGQLVGVSDIIGTEPVNLADKTALASATTAQREYAYLAAGIAELAFTTYDGNTDPVTAALDALVQGTGNGQIDVNDGGNTATVSLADLFAAALTQVPTSDTAVTGALTPLSDAAASAHAGTTDAMLADSDGDGVPDYLDKCPTTPSGTTVDANGCPAGTTPVTHTVTATGDAGGTISPSSATVNDGAGTTFAVTPNGGYIIGTVSGCGGILSGATYTTGAITADCTVTASFLATTATTYTVTAIAGNGGSVSPTTASVADGETTGFTVTPSGGYNIGSVTGCSGKLNGTTYTTGTITGDCTVSATFTPQKIVYVTGGGLSTINADGSNPTALTNVYAATCPNPDFSAPTWSPDRTQIAFACKGFDTNTAGSNANIFVVNADDSNLKQITNNALGVTSRTYAFYPTWSPDGSKIAYEENNGIYIANADGSNPTALTNIYATTCPNPEIADLAWSPDGAQIAFSCQGLDISTFDSNTNIFVVTTDDSNLKQLTNNSITSNNFASDPAWSPDGSKIAYYEHSSIYIANADGSNPSSLTKADGYCSFNGSIAWSPDGTQIAFACKDNTGSGNIFAVYADDSSVRQITDNAAGSGNLAYDPSWR